MNAATGFAQMPAPPYYAVIFSSQRTEGDHGYGEMAERMTRLAARRPGFLGIDSVRGTDGFGITVSYWASTEAIAAWKADVDHRAAQARGMRIMRSGSLGSSGRTPIRRRDGRRLRAADDQNLSVAAA
ncbi:antibiotic biosynthesis monooxygenase family protein [Candidatus Macondimonas diazotrophica]|jgi:heme-degrading monooxygenase HmoA|uniref:antibiotic biosynthesis monooxygenase family protein n=1 Tax=Candidatus Macondimonas diazotrophica TaxID=2305248 RepID=UPI00196B52A6|nr:antibiotic biosynthesis monooxygenase [Candidatus Macondimonas diazotrophica]